MSSLTLPNTLKTSLSTWPMRDDATSPLVVAENCLNLRMTIGLEYNSKDMEVEAMARDKDMVSRPEVLEETKVVTVSREVATVVKVASEVDIKVNKAMETRVATVSRGVEMAAKVVVSATKMPLCL